MTNDLYALRDPRRYGLAKGDQELMSLLSANVAARTDPMAQVALVGKVACLTETNDIATMELGLQACPDHASYAALHMAMTIAGTLHRSEHEHGEMVADVTLAIPLVVQNRPGNHFSNDLKRAAMPTSAIARQLKATDWGRATKFTVLPLLVGIEAAQRLTWYDWAHYARVTKGQSSAAPITKPKHEPFQCLLNDTPQARLLLVTAQDKTTSWRATDAPAVNKGLESLLCEHLTPSGAPLLQVGRPAPVMLALRQAVQLRNVARVAALVHRLSNRQGYPLSFETGTSDDGRGYIVIAASGETCTWELDQGMAWDEQIATLKAVASVICNSASPHAP